MVDGDCRRCCCRCCCRCWIGRWWWCSWRTGGLLLLFSGLVMIATDSNDGSADVVAGITSAAVSTGVTGIADVAAVATTTALSFSTVAFSVPVAMHLNRYGRLPSWNKSRTQCLVIFHSTVKKILATAICRNFLFCYFKCILYIV